MPDALSEMEWIREIINGTRNADDTSREYFCIDKSAFALSFTWLCFESSFANSPFFVSVELPLL